MRRYIRLAGLLLLFPMMADAQQVLTLTSSYASSFTFPNVAANTTVYIAPSLVGPNPNTGALVPKDTTFSNLYIRVTTAPSVAESDVFTVVTGPPASMTPTNITCSVAAGTNTCSDTTHSAFLAAGNAWAVKLVTGATSASGQSMVGLTLSN